MTAEPVEFNSMTFAAIPPKGMLLGLTATPIQVFPAESTARAGAVDAAWLLPSVET
jgi:hypothetical protein